MAHAAAQAEVEDRLAEDGLEALGEGRLRHADRAGERADGRRGSKLPHENGARRMQAAQLPVAVLLGGSSRQRRESRDRIADELQRQRFGVDEAERPGVRVVDEASSGLESLRGERMLAVVDLLAARGGEPSERLGYLRAGRQEGLR